MSIANWLMAKQAEEAANIALLKCLVELSEAKTTVLANQQAADREYRLRVQAESERDDMQRQRDQAGVAFTIELQELKAKVARAVKLLEHTVKHWPKAPAYVQDALEELR